MNIDKKLKELELEFLHGVPVSLNDDMIEQIKQVFKEAGWLPIEGAIAKYFEAGGSKNYYVVSQDCMDKQMANMMTGREWYEKFELLAPEQLTEADKLDFNLHDDDPEGNCYYAYNCAIGDMKRAAKKASGLKD